MKRLIFITNKTERSDFSHKWKDKFSTIIEINNIQELLYLEHGIVMRSFIHREDLLFDI